MPIFEITRDALVQVATTTFTAEHIRERYDLQRLLRDNIGAIAPETYVLAEEYGEWKDAKRRVDLLCLDKQANLVVVELKRRWRSYGTSSDPLRGYGEQAYVCAGG